MMATTIVNAAPAAPSVAGFLIATIPTLLGGALALLGGYLAESRNEGRARRRRSEIASFKIKSSLLTLAAIGKNTMTYRADPQAPYATIGEAVHIRAVAAADRFASCVDDAPELLGEDFGLQLHNFFDGVAINANNNLTIERHLMKDATRILGPNEQQILKAMHETMGEMGVRAAAFLKRVHAEERRSSPPRTGIPRPAPSAKA